MNPLTTATIILIVLAILWTLGSLIPVWNIEAPNFKLVEKQNGFEIREYESAVLIQTQVNGNTTMEEMNQGFMPLGNYIFGGNKEDEKIAMTVPVIHQNNDETALVSFFVPKEYQANELPQPNNSSVNVVETPSQEIAVLKFWWPASSNRYQRKIESLKEKLDEAGITYNSNLIIAAYNPPMTAPWLHKNEIWAILK